MGKFTPLAKIYTAAGTDGMDKFHLWIYPASYKKCSGISSRAVNGRRLSAFVQTDISLSGRLRNLTY